MTDYLYYETALADVIGAPIRLIRSFRLVKFEKNTHWGFCRGEIAYNEDGVTELLKALKIKLPKKKPKTEGDMTIVLLLEKTRVPMVDPVQLGSAAIVYKPRQQYLRVRKSTRNKHYIFAEWYETENIPVGAKFQGDQGNLRVEVSNGELFVQGMLIECAHVQQDLWRLVGRAPRSRRDRTMFER